MFNFKQKSKTKTLEDFELLEINLIKNLPLEYAYVMPNSDRVIQKENKESLMKTIKENPFSIEYVKLGPQREFELASTSLELQGIFLKVRRKNTLFKLIQGLILTLIFIFYLIFTDKEIYINDLAFWSLLLFLFLYSVFHIYRFIKLNNQLHRKSSTIKY